MKLDREPDNFILVHKENINTGELKNRQYYLE